ncbi:hypothetical protein Ancab_027017 [Ancistrocladus abbreviatus]
MVLGLRAKSRRSPSVQVDYLVHVQEIKPWPPSQSLKTIRSVLIQWENGDKSSGSTSTVVPLLDEGRIEFNESFRLSVTLSRDMSVKSADADIFQKNLLEFNLYEPRRDKTVKGHLLGTAIIDLSDYGAVKEIISTNASMSCTRSFRNTAQPILYVKIQCVERSRSILSSRGSLAKVTSWDKNGVDSVSALMNEEYAEEAEVASFTDDDVSSHSSLTASSALDSSAGLPSENEELKESHTLPSKFCLAELDTSGVIESKENQKGSSSHLSSDISIEAGSSANAAASLSNMPERGILSNPGETGRKVEENSPQNFKEEISSAFSAEVTSVDASNNVHEKLNLANYTKCQANEDNERNNSADVVTPCNVHEIESKDPENDEPGELQEEMEHSVGVDSLNGLTLDSIRNQVLSEIVVPFSGDRVKHVKSVRSPIDSARGNGSAGGCFAIFERKDAEAYPAEKRNISSHGKVQELENRVKMLEGELKEAAAIEFSLYSVVGEHGSSTSKVHAPARRLSRLYLHASRRNAHLRRASAARSAVSGLVVVAKACGNDVPRLTFWLSNCVVFRAIISRDFAEQKLPVSGGPPMDKAGVGKGINEKSSRLIWKASSSSKKEIGNISSDCYYDWEDPHTLACALERVESWIFSRIVESIWWQTLTPHMQPSAAKVINEGGEISTQKDYRTLSGSGSGHQDQVNFSLQLWKKAFRDACERLCPVRAGGHECACLPVLAKLIMEQCVARLDVAMFNAILRESADDIPTDPVSDPITDAKVLPIPAGKSSFGAGAQLKNAIGNWSRWLTDLFGMDDDDSVDDETENIGDNDDNEKQHYDSSFKSFYLLKSLSDLMMLPKDMLLSSDIRKEVCPTFGAQLIKRVLNNFVPDEFCPDPIPDAVLEALDSEDVLEDGEGSISNFPCMAPSPVYIPPPSSLITSFIGGTGSQSQLRRSGSSLLRKSITSDDELDELDSPLTSIVINSPRDSPIQTGPNWQAEENGSENAARYQLLREVWMNGV